MNKEAKLPHIELIGDPQENFYQLGLKDRGYFLPLAQSIKSVISTHIKPVDLIVEEVSKAYLKHQLLKNDDFTKNCKAYAEGLERPYEEVALCMLLPELLSNISSWIPSLSSLQLGCSSFFYLDEKSNTPGHVRVLDFPLHNDYHHGERAISYNLTGMPKTFSYNTAGFFYPSISLMTESGISLALHQKFTDDFDMGGTPIFQLVNDLISKCDDKDSIIEFLQSSKSMTTWGINIGLSSGEIIEADINSKELKYNIHNLEDNKIIYFDNSLVDKSINQKLYLPYGISDYNQARKENATKKIATLVKSSKSITDESVLKIASSPLMKKSKYWQIDTHTPSSLMICAFNSSNSSSLYVPGKPLKHIESNLIQFKNTWTEPNQEVIKTRKNKEHPKYIEGMRNLMQAQHCFDKNDIQGSYHNIQLAMERLSPYQEGILAEFYFLVLQFQFEKHKEIRNQIYMDFKKIKNKLSPYLKDHCMLFIMRLEMILSSRTTVHESDIENEMLKEIYKQEMSIPPILLHKTVTLLMNIRIDLQDIIYPHAVIKNK